MFWCSFSDYWFIQFVNASVLFHFCLFMRIKCLLSTGGALFLYLRPILIPLLKSWHYIFFGLLYKIIKHNLGFFIKSLPRFFIYVHLKPYHESRSVKSLNLSIRTPYHRWIICYGSCRVKSVDLAYRIYTSLPSFGEKAYLNVWGL